MRIVLSGLIRRIDQLGLPFGAMSQVRDAAPMRKTSRMPSSNRREFDSANRIG
jgi:hypothetical protein